MCYSALVRTDLDQLALDFAAEVDDLSWQLHAKYQRDEPKKYRVAMEGGRIFPDYFAPVIWGFGDRRKISIMRYGAYPPKYLATDIAKKLTTFNARRDSLEKRFWSEAYRKNHGFVVMLGFFEWVSVAKLVRAGNLTLDDVKKEFAKKSLERKKRVLQQGKPYKPTASELKNPMQREIVISFKPQSNQEMYVPVIISKDPITGLMGFAVVTDEPNKEILATGHDRMPVCLSKHHVGLWSKGVIEDNGVEILGEQTKDFYSHELDKDAA